MQAIKGKDTKPELTVRRLIYGFGYRYRVHAVDLPGKPDLVFRRLKKVIFVHGCFWHQHHNCRFAHLPKSRPDYWLPKLERNEARDEETVRLLHAAGWDVLVVWECQITDPASLMRTIREFLG
jgi:DNA mismatch endonuclease, patch repair protein